MTITLRQESAGGATTKGAALTFAELDNNFIHLLRQGTVEVKADSGTSQTLGEPDKDSVLTLVGGTAVTTAMGSDSAGDTRITINTSAIENVVADTTPQLGGDLDVQTNKITTSTSNGNLTLEANGTGSLVINAGVGINLKGASAIFTDTTNEDITIQSNGTGVISLDSTTAFGAGIEETVYVSTTTTGTYAPSAANGTIHYVVLSGNMTINAFTSPVTGQTITLAFNGTGGSYTLTLGGDIMTPGGSLALTDGGFDIVTITCLDDTTPTYIATAINDFQ
jgi:hypothetical protein